MHTIARSIYLDSEFGVPQDLPHAGSALEVPVVYDDAAREIKQMQADGLVEILGERTEPVDGESLIVGLRFRRLR